VFRFSHPKGQKQAQGGYSTQHRPSLLEVGETNKL